MKKIAIFVICALLSVLLIACSSNEVGKTTSSLTTDAPGTSAPVVEDNTPTISLGGYKVIRATKADSKMVKAAAHLRKNICDNVASDVKVAIDEIRVNETYDPTTKEILIGSDRKSTRLNSSHVT